jgi:SMI1-KNR4 cell-wall
MLEKTSVFFPTFSQLAVDYDLESVQSAASQGEIANIEKNLNLPLPQAYKNLLSCTRGFWLMGGVVQFDSQHPFLHPYSVDAKTSESADYLCFAEFFMEADGDQVMFDLRGGLIDGEYPIVYYAHGVKQKTRLLANSFTEFMENFLTYTDFNS